MCNESIENRIGPSGVVIFDGSCGACSAFIGEKKAFFEKYGFTVAPLQEGWVTQLTGLTEETLLKAIRLYTPEGRVFSSVDFFQCVAQKVWWLAPLALLLRISCLRPFFVWVYDRIAQRRARISKLCGLQSRALYK